jgi:DNA-binding MarR family transcriptional regulator
MSDSRQVANLLREWMEIFATHSMRDMARYVRTSGLSMPQFSILMHLHYRGRCGMSDLGERMEISHAALSQLIERLVQSSLLARTEDPDDRRARRIELTAAGRALIEKGLTERNRWMDELADRLNPREREQVLKIFPALVEAARKLAVPPEH